MSFLERLLARYRHEPVVIDEETARERTAPLTNAHDERVRLIVVGTQQEESPQREAELLKHSQSIRS